MDIQPTKVITGNQEISVSHCFKLTMIDVLIENVLSYHRDINANICTSYIVSSYYKKIRDPEDKKRVNERQQYIREKLRTEMGLLVDIPKPGFGTTNDGILAFSSHLLFLLSRILISNISGVVFHLPFSPFPNLITFTAATSENPGFINGTPPTGENYRIIYQALVDKFSDKRAMANSYLDQIINFKQAPSETASNLNAFLEKFNVAVNSLQKLAITNLDDYILAYLALSKLNPETQRSFENAYRKTEMPSYDDIVTFVKEQAKICSRSTNKRVSSFSDRVKIDNKTKQTHSFLVQNNSSQNKCSVCKIQVHPITGCPKFLSMSPADRYTFSKNNSLCLNCLGMHKIINCKSSFSCRICRSRHHTLLHFNSNTNPSKVENRRLVRDSHIPQIPLSEPLNSSDTADAPQESNHFQIEASCSRVDTSLVNYCSIANNASSDKCNKIVLLSTAKVNISDSFGKQHVARFLLDSCSQANFLTLDFCRRLKLKLSKCYREVQGIGATGSKIYGGTNIVITSQIDASKRYPLEVLVVEKITNKLPQVEINVRGLSHLTNIPLADNSFHQPNKIDGIIGADLYPYLIGQGRVIGPPKAPVALETQLGYVVMGSVSLPVVENTFHSFCSIVDPSIETLVKRFWEIEEIQCSPVMHQDDFECENIFQSTSFRTIYSRSSLSI
ncbi:hypothetical protein NQ317_008909 [Molorchus minor]|uniref:Peptidase aspartic putative domain-containing protein n=1 Tax=Molorchus minor TaxID=1323400 RepID=A0ABQ9JS06_9CUCU|nr:hypothetical protein NQ317_008909 [Molorchus minor]